MTDEITHLRDKNHELQSRIVGLELQIAQMSKQHSQTYELNEILQNRLRENGLSPYVTASDLKAADEPKPESHIKTRAATLTTNMRTVLREVMDGTNVDHGRSLAPRERAGRGRTLDTLQQRGYLDSNYRPTELAKSLAKSANS